MSKILKNPGQSDFFITDMGDNVPATGQLEIPPNRYNDYAGSNITALAIANGDLIMNDGSQDITVEIDALNFLMGAYPSSIDLVNKTASGIPKVAMYEPEGDFETVVSHDFSDKTTWYGEATHVTGQSLTLDTGTTFASPDTNWIDLTHGKVTREDEITGHDINVYDNAVLVDPANYTIDYVNGKITLTSAPSGAVTAEYSYANGSAFIYAPTTKVKIKHAEVQFTSDVVMKPLCFEIWAYDPDNPPNKKAYEKVVYKNEKDLVNISNKGYRITSFGIFAADLLVFPFEYTRAITLDPASGMEMRLGTVGDETFGGFFATLSLYMAEA
jgi:hypothetical protein